MKNVSADQIVYSTSEMKNSGAGCWFSKLQEESENRVLWARNIRLRGYEIQDNKTSHSPVKTSIWNIHCEMNNEGGGTASAYLTPPAVLVR